MGKVNHRRNHRKRCLMCRRPAPIVHHGKCVDCRWRLVVVRMNSRKPKAAKGAA